MPKELDRIFLLEPTDSKVLSRIGEQKTRSSKTPTNIIEIIAPSTNACRSQISFRVYAFLTILDLRFIGPKPSTLASIS